MFIYPCFILIRPKPSIVFSNEMKQNEKVVRSFLCTKTDGEGTLGRSCMMRAYQDPVGEALDDVLDDGDGGELDGADVAHEADGDEADGELEDGGEDGREGDVPQQLRLLPALAQRRLPHYPHGHGRRGHG